MAKWSGVWLMVKLLLVLSAYPYYISHHQWPQWFLTLHDLLKSMVE